MGQSYRVSEKLTTYKSHGNLHKSGLSGLGPRPGFGLSGGHVPRSLSARSRFRREQPQDHTRIGLRTLHHLGRRSRRSSGLAALLRLFLNLTVGGVNAAITGNRPSLVQAQEELRRQREHLASRERRAASTVSDDSAKRCATALGLDRKFQAPYVVADVSSTCSCPSQQRSKAGCSSRTAFVWRSRF